MTTNPQPPKNEAKALATRDEEVGMMAQMGYSAPMLRTIANTVAVGATVSELAFFLNVAQHLGLSPFMRQIHFVKRQGQVAIQVGIDGYRAVADRTDKYAGNSDPDFSGPESVEELKKKCGCPVCKSGIWHPMAATVTVKKILVTKNDGEPVLAEFAATAHWIHYLPAEGKSQFMWKKMAGVMIAKCAEALALRKAFPAQLAGAYTHEEMQQAGGLDPSLEVADDGTSQEVTPLRANTVEPDPVAAPAEVTPKGEPVEIEQDPPGAVDEKAKPKSTGKKRGRPRKTRPEDVEKPAEKPTGEPVSESEPASAPTVPENPQPPSQEATEEVSPPSQEVPDSAISVPDSHGSLVALAIGLVDYGTEVLERDLLTRYFAENCPNLAALGQIDPEHASWLRRRVITVIQVENVSGFNKWVKSRLERTDAQ